MVAGDDVVRYQCNSLCERISTTYHVLETQARLSDVDVAVMVPATSGELRCADFAFGKGRTA